MSKFLKRAVALVAIALGASACGDGPIEGDLQMAVVAGSYQAEGPYGTLTTEPVAGGPLVDWLALGASIVIELQEDGSTSGRLFVPGADEDGGDLEADLVGRWILSGDVVRFEQEADTFLRDVPLRYTDGRLAGEATFDNTIRLVLEER